MSGDYIKLHRQLMDWEWYKDGNTVRLWVHLLLKANWKPGRFQGVDVMPGQLITSIATLSEETGLSPHQIRTSLLKLEKSQNLTSKVTSKWRLVTIEKWGFYQGRPSKSDKQLDKRVTNEWQTSDNNRRKEEGKKGRSTPKPPQGAGGWDDPIAEVERRRQEERRRKEAQK